MADHPYPSEARRIPPGPGQESVWDYPRPPRCEAVDERIRVEFGGGVIADSGRAIRVLQTGIPPVYYLLPEDVKLEHLERSEHHSVCEYKGQADYYDLRVGDRVVKNAAWSYPDPPAGVTPRDHLAFYAHLVDACYVGDERATLPEWKWLGGWVTSGVVGPFLTQADLKAVRDAVE